MDKFWQKNKSAFLYARELTKEYSKSFYVSSLLLPKPQRWATFAVYGFCRYVDNLIDKPRKRTAEDIRTEIENLKSELTLAYQSGESEHPVISPFITTALHFDIPIEYPLELITGVLMDLDKKIYQTFDDLYLFCYRVAGVVGLMMTHITGYTNKDAFVCAEKLGIAFQLTNILRDIKEDKDMGRIYIPQQEIKKFGVTVQDIQNENFSLPIKNLIKHQIQRAREYYQQAFPGIAMLSKHSQYSIYSALNIYQGILGKIEKNDYNPFLGRVYVPFLNKLCIILSQFFRTRVLF